MGATGTGKSRLSVDVATHFRGEIINSDKMQLYKGLEIVTNKITHAEKQGLVDEVRQIFIPDADYTKGIRRFIGVPEMDRYLREETNIDGDDESKQMILQASISSIKCNTRLVDEVRQIFIPDADYTKGIRRSISVPEMDRYLREETNIDGDDESKQMILQASISSIKRNTHKMNTFINNEEFNKKKVIFIMRATGMGKSCLSVDVATHFRGEIINSDKQGEIEPDSDFTAEDFRLQAVVYIEKILKTQRVPIIVGGSNSYIEKLGEDLVFMFKYKYDSCFIWIDVEQSVLNHRVDMRVDQMVKAKDEVRQIFNPDADYTKGIRQSIGVPEMDKYLREETNRDGDNESKQMILQSSISSIKRDTRMLICNQPDKIDGLISEKMW
ncbi:adenylate isopentenyltransferase 5, chloroplastic-like [Solanum pennellii]|uniref:Adenylate isopentenyltransferase 5, chloroplastic-like n=1 Tax=Solanum pennellii TaxID=28526 RepID=A0ABM1FIU3_SOLPN|nr:adenylate isopentenyltransferase 5, chloroplastic-like [Solanum pennellii]